MLGEILGVDVTFTILTGSLIVLARGVFAVQAEGCCISSKYSHPLLDIPRSSYTFVERMAMTIE